MYEALFTQPDSSQEPDSDWAWNQLVQVLSLQEGSRFNVSGGVGEVMAAPVEEFTVSDIVEHFCVLEFLDQDEQGGYRRTGKEHKYYLGAYIDHLEKTRANKIDIATPDGMQEFVRRKLMQAARESEIEHGVLGCGDYVTPDLIVGIARVLSDSLPTQSGSGASLKITERLRSIWVKILADEDDNLVSAQHPAEKWAERVIDGILDHPQNVAT